jgi:hypothetical protein
MFKYLIAPMKVAGLLLLLAGLFIIAYLNNHLSRIGPYISILGILFLLTDLMADSMGRKLRTGKSLEAGLLLLVTAVVLILILDVTGVISLLAWLST